MMEQFSAVTKTAEQGAATSPDLEGIGGRYLEDCHEAETVDAIVEGVHGVLPHALDPGDARRLWDVSQDLLAGARARR